MPPKAPKAKTAMKKTMKATKAKKAKVAMKAKDKGMRASFRKTKIWSGTWVGMYYMWELVGLKWNKGYVLETWHSTLRPGELVAPPKAMKPMFLGDEEDEELVAPPKAMAMKAMKAKTAMKKTMKALKAMTAMKAKQ